MVIAAAIIALTMCKACEEAGGNPFALPSAGHKPWLTSAAEDARPPGAAAEIKPLMVQREEPVYPTTALRDGIEGRVVVRFQISPDGTPYNVSVESSSDAIFDREAIRALSASRFAPDAVGRPAYARRWFRQPYAFRFAD